ncbi:MAG: MFS transporter [Oscillospiraceae bacterium]|nr:MFS transporter [Oscillospiraceae bacterium]
MRQLKTYTPRERNMYLFAMFGQNMIFSTIPMFTNYVARDVLFIPAIIVGLIMTIAQVWDAINDPIMGVIVDRTRSKYGKCRPYLMWAPSGVYVFTMLCFLCPPYSYAEGVSPWRNVGVVAWALIAYILFDLFYTAGDIPLWGITALMTEDEKHRQKLQANARIIGGIGGGLAMALFQPIALAVGQSLGSDRSGVIVTALGFLTLGYIAFQMAGIFVREKITTQNQKVNTFKENVQMLWSNRPFRQLLVSGVLATPRNILMLVAVPLVTYYFSSKDPGKALFYTALIGGGVFAGMFPAQILAPRLMDRFGKHRLYMWCNLGELPINLLLFLVYLLSLRLPGGLTHPAMLVVLTAMFLVKGVAMGLFIVLQTAMITDTVDYEDFTHNVRPDGVFFSGLTFMAKIGNGISTLLYQTLSAIVGMSGVNLMILQNMLNEGKIPREVMQRGGDMVVHRIAEGALTSGQIFNFFTMMFIAISIIPAISNVLALLPMRKYELTEAKLAEVLEVLQIRRREEGGLAE